MNMVLLLVRICLFRAKPQDLPASRNLLMHCIAGATAAFVIRNLLLGGSNNMVMMALLQSVLLGASLYLLLRIFSKPERWLQSASALYGCSAVVVALMLPVLAASGPDAIFDNTVSLIKFIVIVSSGWYFAITVFILKETLEIRLLFGVGIAIAMEIIIATGIAALLGGPAS
ncbi:MAG: hypothetical protein F4093_11205 [Gammaproteobacteria bacterium]|nr:hypothetical protein [Gammaproteobacteria bacterium]MYJ53192.1 hypothetical protein [Gammaproteobacteria bacterium]